MSEPLMWAADHVDVWRPFAYLVLASVVLACLYAIAWATDE